MHFSGSCFVAENILLEDRPIKIVSTLAKISATMATDNSAVNSYLKSIVFHSEKSNSTIRTKWHRFRFWITDRAIFLFPVEITTISFAIFFIHVWIFQTFFHFVTTEWIRNNVIIVSERLKCFIKLNYKSKLELWMWKKPLSHWTLNLRNCKDIASIQVV